MYFLSSATRVSKWLEWLEWILESPLFSEIRNGWPRTFRTSKKKTEKVLVTQKVVGQIHHSLYVKSLIINNFLSEQITFRKSDYVRWKGRVVSHQWIWWLLFVFSKLFSTVWCVEETYQDIRGHNCGWWLNPMVYHNKMLPLFFKVETLHTARAWYHFSTCFVVCGVSHTVCVCVCPFSHIICDCKFWCDSSSGDVWLLKLFVSAGDTCDVLFASFQMAIFLHFISGQQNFA